MGVFKTARVAVQQATGAKPKVAAGMTAGGSALVGVPLVIQWLWDSFGPVGKVMPPGVAAALGGGLVWLAATVAAYMTREETVVYSAPPAAGEAVPPTPMIKPSGPPPVPPAAPPA
jgi:hypothetical protein